MTTKYRGKSIIDGTWVYGYIYHSGQGKTIIITPNSEDLPYIHIEVLPHTLGQFIGVLCDNREVFTGDVIENKNTNKFLVEFHLGSFLLRYLSGIEKPTNGFILAYDFNFDHKKIIGNLTDNPEFVTAKYHAQLDNMVENICRDIDFKVNYHIRTISSKLLRDTERYIDIIQEVKKYLYEDVGHGKIPFPHFIEEMKNLQPMTGFPLEVLNKTANRMLSKTPTTLHRK